MRFLLVFFASALALAAAAFFLPGLAIIRLEGLLTGAIFIALANILVVSILELHTKRSIILYAALALIVNGVAFWILSTYMYGLVVYSTRAGVITVFALAIISTFFYFLAGKINHDQKKSSRKSVLMVVGIFAGMIVALLLSQILIPNATISGTVIVNGLLPEDSQRAKIVLLSHLYRSGEQFKVANNNIPLSRKSNWRWTEAKEGKTYQLQAYIEVGGRKLSTSNVILTTAPANNQILIIDAKKINFTGAQIKAAKEVPTATISAVLNLNGIVPDGSTVTIYRNSENNVLGISSGTVVIKGNKAVSNKVDNIASTSATTVPATDGLELSWIAAVPGQVYTYYAVLDDASGNEIGRTRNTQTVVAPSVDNVVRINSTVQPASTTPEETTTGGTTDSSNDSSSDNTASTSQATISGYVQINGPIPLNSGIAILEKLPSETEWRSVATVEAVNGIGWSWDGAVAGTEYSMSAALQVNGAYERYGSTTTVVAPASGLTVTIDTGTDSGGGGEVVEPTPTPTPPGETPTSAPPISGEATPSATTSPAPSTTSAPTPTHAPTAAPTHTPSPTHAPTTTPAPSAGPTSTPSPTPPPINLGCSVNYQKTDDWGGGFTADVRIKNLNSTNIKTWTLSWSFSGNQYILSDWDTNISQTGQNVSARNLGYNSTILANGGIVTFGFNASYWGTNNNPTSFSLNGTGCSLGSF